MLALPRHAVLRLPTGFRARLPPKSHLHTSPARWDIFTVQDEADFKAKVLDSEKLVLVDFHATWCGPCRMMGPRLETLVGSRGDKVDLAKVDVDEQEQLATQYKVQTIPAIFAVKRGKILDHFVGSRDEDQINEFIDNALAK